MYTTNVNFVNGYGPVNTVISIPLKDIFAMTSDFTIVAKDLYSRLNNNPYTEGIMLFNPNHSILRQDSNGCIVYYLNYNGEALTIKNPNKISKLFILDNSKHLNDIKHSRGNVIIGRNYYAVDSSDIAREITIFKP